MSNSIAWRKVRIERLSISQGPPRELLDVRPDSLESARVQTLRGIACLLLVAFHTIGSTAASGLQVPDDSPYREFTNLFVHVRMPLFTFLSGLVYAYRPLRAGQAAAVFRQEASPPRPALHRRIDAAVLPELRDAARGATAAANVDASTCSPTGICGSCRPCCLCSRRLSSLESLGALSTFTRFMLVFALSLGLYSYGPFESQAFGLHNATYLLPFFLGGLGAHRFRDRLHLRRVLIATVLCFVVTQSFHTYIVLTRALAPIVPSEDRSAIHLLIGLSASLCAVQLLPRMRLMERIGGSAYPIYLYHPLFVAAVFFAAGTPVAASTGLLFLLAGVAGIVGPMLMERGARHIPGGQLLLEGRVAPAVIRMDEALPIGGRSAQAEEASRQEGRAAPGCLVAQESP